MNWQEMLTKLAAADRLSAIRQLPIEDLERMDRQGELSPREQRAVRSRNLDGYRAAIDSLPAKDLGRQVAQGELGGRGGYATSQQSAYSRLPMQDLARQFQQGELGPVGTRVAQRRDVPGYQKAVAEVAQERVQSGSRYISDQNAAMDRIDARGSTIGRRGAPAQSGGEFMSRAPAAQLAQIDARRNEQGAVSREAERAKFVASREAAGARGAAAARSGWNTAEAVGSSAAAGAAAARSLADKKALLNERVARQNTLREPSFVRQVANAPEQKREARIALNTPQGAMRPAGVSRAATPAPPPGVPTPVQSGAAAAGRSVVPAAPSMPAGPASMAPPQRQAAAQPQGIAATRPSTPAEYVARRNATAAARTPMVKAEAPPPPPAPKLSPLGATPPGGASAVRGPAAPAKPSAAGPAPVQMATPVAPKVVKPASTSGAAR